MANIYVSGLINTETTLRVRGFPLDYYPIDYPFFGIQSAVSGVAYNIAKALHTLGDEVTLCSLIGVDMTGDLALAQLERDGIGREGILRELSETPSSIVLYDGTGRRQIHCDLKDIQERAYPVDDVRLARCDIVAACNINFNRPLLERAKAMGKTIATDVHVLSNPEDEYNRAFMEAADILFLSDEALPCDPWTFLRRLAERFGNEVIVLGRGAKGALLYLRERDAFHELPCVRNDHIVNTVGAGDALFSGFLHFTAKGMEPVEALWHAQVFASAKCSAAGAAQGFITEADVIGCRRRVLLG